MVTTRKKLPMLSAALGGLVIVISVFYLVNAASAGSSTADESPSVEEDSPVVVAIPVRTTAVGMGAVSSYISTTANLVPENEVKVLAEWQGRLTDLRVEEGDWVKKGALLALLAPEDGEIAVEKARIKAETQQQAYSRANHLHQQELLSLEAFERTRLESEIARQELAEARWRLTKTQIRAPFAGRVTQRMVQQGQHVRIGDELFTVADFDPLVARIYLPERDVLALDIGRQVRLALKANEATKFVGRVRQISPVVDTATGTVKVTIEVGSPPAEVRPGAFVRVDIVRETRTEVALIPRGAVVRELQKAFVFVYRDGQAERRLVALGIEEGDQVEALSGIAAGEQIIVAGQGGLEDGSAVKRLDEDAATTPSAKPVAAS